MVMGYDIVMELKLRILSRFFGKFVMTKKSYNQELRGFIF
jgi:hypothetical protein